MNPDIVANVERLNMFQDLPAPLQTGMFLGAMMLIPALLVCMTGFTRIVIVLSFARRAVTSQDIPPNQVITGLSLFLTLFVMGPTWDQLDEKAISPYLKETITAPVAVDRGITVMRTFMLKQTRRQGLALFIHMARVPPPETAEETPLRVLVPAFVISELKTAFIMGFCIYLPFLLVDLVVSSVLTSMGMVMMPPVVVSAPFKVLLFVLADGWHLIAHALSSSFG